MSLSHKPLTLKAFRMFIYSKPSKCLRSIYQLSSLLLFPLPQAYAGENTAPNWGLEKIGEQEDDGTSYSYPDNTNPVRLYLIDTAVANPGNWMDENPNLIFEGTTLIRSYGDPTTSSEFAHATGMLSLISGVTTGVAPGTPIHVTNYDIYPNGDSSSGTLLESAIWNAVFEYQDAEPQIPAVICIANGSLGTGSSSSLQSTIEFAVEEGITVVISAGNSNADASNFIPSSYGTIDGVICVGATDSSDLKTSISNYGSAVDISAPGENIKARSYLAADTFYYSNGTSPASALVAGSALAELSMNGSLTPAEVESTLIAAAAVSSTDGAPPILRTTPTASATIALPDGPITDPSTPISLAYDELTVPDLSEQSTSTPELSVFYGTTGDSETSNLVSLSPEDEILFTFPVNLTLLDPDNIFSMRNGYSWRICCGENLNSWAVPMGSLSKSTASDGTVWITATIPANNDHGFIRIEVID
ncbi:MAG: S8 family serine peptidase [Luteolibacter sp.]